MNRDPFEVLGISSSATEDEIKDAYRKLAKRYHPDLHPGDRQAEEKMKEINEAYSEAMQYRKTGSYSSGAYSSGDRSYTNGTGGFDPFRGGWGPWRPGWGGTGPNPFSGTGWSGTGQEYASFDPGHYDDPVLEAAAQALRAGKYADAVAALDRVLTVNAAWHYLYALAQQGLGNQMSALNHARQAAAAEPDSALYARLLRVLEGPAAYYRRSGGGSRIGSALLRNPCAMILGFNLLLNCFCGPRFWLCC